MKKGYRATPVLQAYGRYYVPAASGARAKAIAEAEKWLSANRLPGEVWAIEVTAYEYR
jgi:hypothetical protein